MSRLGRGLALSVAPIITGLYVGATSFGGTVWPWRPVMVDLEVYRTAGRVLLQGGDFYSLPGPLQFLYPPFAAVLSVPLALLPGWLAQVGWTVAGVLALLAVLYRCGLTGWVLSLVGCGCVYLVEPVSETLAFGQLGIFLVALVFLDLAPGPRLLPRPLLPQGALTALAASIKLTPAIFVIYLLATRKWRAAIVALITGVVVTVASAVVTPRASVQFWGRLAHGDTGLGHSIIYYTNQSVMADVVRIFGLGSSVALAGLALSGLVALVGVWAALLWHRLGDSRLALNLCGVAGLLASPVSWLHHFVWVVPLALSLVEGRPGGRAARPLPSGMFVLGWLFIGWLVVSPFRRLPNGGDVELLWTGTQNALASMTAVLGVALLVTSIVSAQRRRHQPGYVAARKLTRSV